MPNAAVNSIVALHEQPMSASERTWSAITS